MLTCLYLALSHTHIFVGDKEQAMKLIGSYTSPFVRKISVILLEAHPFEFVNESPTAKATACRAITRWAKCRRW